MPIRRRDTRSGQSRLAPLQPTELTMQTPQIANGLAAQSLGLIAQRGKPWIGERQ
jgi:hypothetical protein